MADDEEKEGEAKPAASTTYLNTKELADRWRVNTQTLTNQRFRSEGIPWTKPDGHGRPLYNLVDVLAAERAGHGGFTWSKLAKALGAVLKLSADEAEKLVEKIRRAMR